MEDIRAISKTSNYPGTKKEVASHHEYNKCEKGESTRVRTVVGENRVTAMDVGTFVTLDLG